MKNFHQYGFFGFPAFENPFSSNQPPKALVQPQPFSNQFGQSMYVSEEDKPQFDHFRFDSMKPFFSIFGFSESNWSENELKNNIWSIFSSWSVILSLAFFVLPSLIGFHKIREGNQEHDMTDADVSRLGQCNPS